MKSRNPLLVSIGLVFIIGSIIASCSLVGCASTNWQTAAGKFLTSTALTADATMKGAATLEVQGIISTNDWLAIRGYYVQYQSAMAIATNTYTLAVTLDNPALFIGPSNNLFTAQSSLTSKVTTLTPNKP